MQFLKNIRCSLWVGWVMLIVSLQPQTVCAQPYTIADSVKAMKLIRDGFNTLQTDPARSLALATEGVAISKQIGFIKGIEKGSRTVADACTKSGDVKKALAWYTDALNVSRQYQHSKDEALTLGHLGNLFLFIGALDKALEYNLQALEIEKQTNDTIAIADQYNNIAVILNDQGMFSKSIEDLLITVDMYHRIHDSEMEAKSLDYIGANYVCMKKYPEALNYFSRSLKIRQSAETYSNIGDYYEGVKNDDSALHYFRIALDRFEADSDRLDMGKMLNNMGELEIRKGNYKDAETHLEYALAIVKKLSDVEEIGNAENNLSRLYAMTGDFKSAYQHHLEATFYKDSLQNAEKAKKFEEINTRYEVKELADRNTALENENGVQKLKLQRKNILIVGAVSALLALLAIGILLFRQSKLRASQQSAELEQKQLRAQMNPHFIFNCLNSIQHFIVANDVKNANKYLSGFALLMRQTLENSKEGIITLRKEIAYLENYLVLERMRFEDKFIYEIVCAENVNIDQVEIPSMIIQPFIENAIRHGLCYLEDRPGKLKISFYKSAGFLCCEVDDNGIGREQSQRLKQASDVVYESQGMELTRRRLALVSKSSGAEYKIDHEHTELFQKGQNIFGKA